VDDRDPPVTIARESTISPVVEAAPMNKTLLLLTALVSASAFAQETAPPPPPPQPAPVAMVAADAPMEDPGGRVRWGMGVNLGWNIPTSAFVGGVEGRVGWQLSRMLSIFGFLGAHFGLGINASVQGSVAQGGVTLFGAYYAGAIAEAMLADFFYFGGGALIGSGGYGGFQVGANSNGATTVSELGQLGLMFGIDGRLGINLGRPKGPPSYRRSGFNIGLDVMAIFRPNTVIATQTADASGNFGATVNTNALTASVIPMLTLGFDSR
jgi:hypothetical protein